MILKKYRKGDRIYILLRCDNCKKEIEVEQGLRHVSKSRFCSKECNDDFHNKNRPIHKKCKFCHNEYTVNIRTAKRSQFCSKICFYSWQRKKTQDMINSIEDLQKIGLSNNDIAKRLKTSKQRIINFISYYKLSRGQNRILSKKIKVNKWTEDELSVLREHINNFEKFDDITYLIPKIMRSPSAIMTKLSKIRKQLAGG